MRAARQIIIFLVFVIGIIVILSMLFGGSKGSKKSVAPSFDLLKYTTRDSKVVAITDGPINGDDVHRAVRITVDRNTRRIDVIQGYQGTVIATKSYDNNQKAYDEFLHALSKSGFGKPRKSAIASEDGVCATGRRYVFEVIDNNDSVSRTWTASCQKGNTIALPSRITGLFRDQITDYNEVVKGQKL